MARGSVCGSALVAFAGGRGVSVRGAGLVGGLGRVPAPPTRVLVLGVRGRCVPHPSSRARMTSSLGRLPGTVRRVFTRTTLSNPRTNPLKCTIIIPEMQMRKLRHRDKAPHLKLQNFYFMVRMMKVGT